MAFRITPPVFRREIERRLLDVRGVMQLLGVNHRSGIWKRVETGSLPPPILNKLKAYALWDADEIAQWKNGRK